jgi:predicted acetyltransferase
VIAVTVTPARRDEHDLVRAYYSRYLHELTAVGAEYQLDENGEWQPDLLPYWLDQGEDHHVLLVRDDSRVVGFAFVLSPPSPWLTPGRDYVMSELYVAPDERDRGVGAAAARALFDRVLATRDRRVHPRRVRRGRGRRRSGPALRQRR